MPRKTPSKRTKPGQPEPAAATPPAAIVKPEDFVGVPQPDPTASTTKTREIAGWHLPDALEEIDALRRDEVEREMRRAAMAAEVAKHRWIIAQHFHRLESGEPLNFRDYPFQPPLYHDDATEVCVMGSTQWGKTEFLLCTAFSCAAAGLRVLFILSKQESRERLVKTRIDPPIKSVPFYRKLVEYAEKNGKVTDSQKIKHLGDGTLIFVNAKSVTDATSIPADVIITDEHQDCDVNNLPLFENRLNGSPWRMKVVVGNPRTMGTEANQNLHWIYQQSDQRRWQVPCPSCKTMQTLDWWQHVVREERNKNGGIIRVSPRDTNWRPGVLDIRPICPLCNQPMNRLSRDGLWVATNPGHPRHGYQLSNIHNANVRLDAMFAKYQLGLHHPSKMADFVNNQLGMPWNHDGASISDAMLAACATGEFGGAGRADPYRLRPASQIRWRQIDVA